jgi:hypothetical protein
MLDYRGGSVGEVVVFLGVVWCNPLYFGRGVLELVVSARDRCFGPPLHRRQLS